MRVRGLFACALLSACGRIGFDGLVDGDASLGSDAVDGAVALGCVAQMAIGDEHACARLGDGSLWCWGRNEVGQLGNGGIADAAHVPMRTLAGPYTSVGAGGNHTCGHRQDRLVECWGNNGNHQVTMTSPNTGTPIVTAVSVDAIVISGSHSCGTIGTGGVCWGDTDGGQLGDNTAVDSVQSPTPMGESSMTRLFSGEDHLCATTPSGLRCWGVNSTGQLGTDPGNTLDLCQDVGSQPVPCSQVPRSVAGLPPIVDVGLGRTHTCAVGNDQTVYCWGDNTSGALGDGSFTTHSTPAPVIGVVATKVAAGRGFSCALTTDAIVMCWGENRYGVLANGLTVDRNTAASVGLTGVSEIGTASSGDTMCARTNTGVYCWGRNQWGLAGDSGGADVMMPALALPACP